MSSHHFVREGQEPALVVANGLACSQELLFQLLEWAPFVVALDGAFDRLWQLNIKVDAVIGDFDSSFNSLTPPYPLEQLLITDQNSTDLEKGIDFLISKGTQAANIIWATGYRTDHTLSNISILAKYHPRIVLNIIDDYSRIFHAGKKFTKWYPQGTIISLMPLGKVEGVTTENLKFPLKNESLELGYRNGNSNQVSEDGWVKVNCESGDLLIMECRDSNMHHHH